MRVRDNKGVEERGPGVCRSEGRGGDHNAKIKMGEKEKGI